MISWTGPEAHPEDPNRAMAMAMAMAAVVEAGVEVREGAIEPLTLTVATPETEATPGTTIIALVALGTLILTG